MLLQSKAWEEEGPSATNPLLQIYPMTVAPNSILEPAAAPESSPLFGSAPAPVESRPTTQPVQEPMFNEWDNVISVDPTGEQSVLSHPFA